MTTAPPRPNSADPPAAPAKEASSSVREVTISPDDVRHGRPRRWWRAFRELAGVPVLVVLAFCCLAVVSIIADQTRAVGLLDAARTAAGHVVGKQAATAALQAIATGLVTVTSITFSVLLLAVQQTASNLSPVVFDQFIRRRSNQAFLGFFVGLALFAYVVMTAVKDSTPPILGATIASVLTVVALAILLVLVFSTVAQMRPTSVVRAIHDRTLAAREEEAVLLRRTRRESTSGHDVAVVYRARVTGYVTHLDLRLLATALEDGGDAEICLTVTLGDHVCYGDTLATVLDGDLDRAESLARRVAPALSVSPQRDLAHDPTTGIDELSNIAWTSGSTSKQNPEVAREALYALQDLAARWFPDEPTAGSAAVDEPPIAVVYRDTDRDRLFDVLHAMLVVAHESHQTLFAASVVDVYSALLQRVDAPARDRLRADLGAAGALLDAIPASPALDHARRAAGIWPPARRTP
jgi:uncharacterized membrane protein